MLDNYEQLTPYRDLRGHNHRSQMDIYCVIAIGLQQYQHTNIRGKITVISSNMKFLVIFKMKNGTIASVRLVDKCTLSEQ